MQLLLSPSVIVEAGTALGILIAAIYFPWRDSSRRASLIGSVLMITAALWILTHSLEIGTPVSSDKAYLMGLQLIWGLVAMTLWLMYIIHYIAPGKWRTSRIYTLFGIMPLLAILAVITNNIHGLVWTDPGLDIHNPYLPLQPVYGLFYWVCMAYMSAMTVFGGFLIVSKVIRQPNFRRWEPQILILAAVVPLFAAFFEITGFLQVTGLTIGITPFFSGLGVIMLIGSLPRFQLGQIIPIAQAVVFERISDSVVVLDVQNRIVDLNPAAEDLAGCTSSEALGLPVEQVWPSWPSQLLLSKPVSAVYEELILIRAGEERTYDLHVYIISDHENRPRNKLALLSDVSERKQAEAKLVLSKRFLDIVIEQSPVSLWISDSEGTLVRMNQACRELFGVTDEEVVGKYNIFKDNLIEEQGFIPLVKNVFEKGEIARFTIDYDLLKVEHVKVKEGTHRILNLIISPIKDINGKIINMLVQHLDITERKQIEEKEERYRSRLEALHELVLQLDNSHTVDQTIESTEIILQNFYRAEYESLALVEGSDLVVRSGLARSLRFPLSGGGIVIKAVNEARTIVVDDVTKDPDYFEGNIKALSELAVPLIVRGKAIGVLNIESTRRNAFTVEDVKLAETLARHVSGTLERISLTEKQQRTLEATLRQEAAAERARELAAVKTRFYSSATHEIRTPLTSISGYTELIQNALQSGDTSKLPVYFDAVRRNAERLTRLTDDLLDTQRIAENRLMISRLPVETSDLLRDVAQEATPGLTRRGQTLEVRDELDVTISVDRDRIIQVLANLVGNASKFSPRGATIHLSVEGRGGEVCFSVRDDGVGLTEGDVLKLFNPFPGIHVNGNTESTGLGLSISKGIVELHGGRIWAESGGPGNGSTFSFTVPVVEP